MTRACWVNQSIRFEFVFCCSLSNNSIRSWTLALEIRLVFFGIHSGLVKNRRISSLYYQINLVCVFTRCQHLDRYASKKSRQSQKQSVILLSRKRMNQSGIEILDRYWVSKFAKGIIASDRGRVLRCLFVILLRLDLIHLLRNLLHSFFHGDKILLHLFHIVTRCRLNCDDSFTLLA